jgi:serine/threonine-protein kinase
MAEKQPRDFGPYVLEKLISAEGGQGLVYLATHKALEKRVVIKILKDHLAKHESFVERFASEAAQLARMDHANIVRVRQTGPMGDAFFIEMEFIEGWDLSSWLKEHGRLPVEIAVVVLQRFAAGLQHAHERSIIHRDVKPGNVMLTASGEVKVLDFGLARDMDAEGRSTPGTLMGTYAYMSPEQVDGEEATTSFDVYALGVVAYQLLANKIPFEGTIATV